MERKTQFESVEDVNSYFASQYELWEQPKPRPPRFLWERMEKALNRPELERYGRLPLAFVSSGEH